MQEFQFCIEKDKNTMIINKISSITFSYCATEDRIFSSIGLISGEEKVLWFTRKFTNSICLALAQYLDGQNSKSINSPAEREKKLKVEIFETKSSVWKKNNDKRIQNTYDQSQTEDLGLCKTIHIKKNELSIELIVVDKIDNQFAMPLDRKQLLKILMALFNIAQKNLWEVNLPSEWDAALKRNPISTLNK